MSAVGGSSSLSRFFKPIVACSLSNLSVLLRVCGKRKSVQHSVRVPCEKRKIYLDEEWTRLAGRIRVPFLNRRRSIRALTTLYLNEVIIASENPGQPSTYNVSSHLEYLINQLIRPFFCSLPHFDLPVLAKCQINWLSNSRNLSRSPGSHMTVLHLNTLRQHLRLS
jgi:hypothetical protein